MNINSAFRLIRYDARVQIGSILFLISIYTIFIGGFYQESINTYAAVITAILLDGIILRYQKKRWVLPYSAVVTGLLVGLILNPDFTTWQFILVTTVAIASKYLIPPGKKHVFNPASFGLVMASFAFGGAITWWGVSWSPHVWIFIFVAAGYVLWRLRRLWLPVGFLIIYWLYLSFQGGLSLNLISDPTVALFAFIMLPEPQTSPIFGHFRYTFGFLTVAFVIFYSVFFPQIPSDPLLISLVSANLVGFSLTKLVR